MGVIYAPKRNELYYAAEGLGAFCNDYPIHVNEDKDITSTLVVSETNPYGDREVMLYPKLFKAFFKDCVDCRITGSAALDCCYVACGRAGIFVCEVLKPWDYTAGEILIKEAGGVVSQWNGEDMTYLGQSTIIATNGIVYADALKRISVLKGND